jgi:adenosylcobinamide kinase/adenosylcobinamide-phosphate guanylyltransferase
LSALFAQLVLGGARSGKTAFALSEAAKSGLEKWMIVTSRTDDLDSEMQDRIAAHRAERGFDWTVVEEPSELLNVLEGLARTDRIVVVDCLTLWLSNLLSEQRDLSAEAARLASGIKGLSGSAIFVSNEIGLGLVPETPVGRVFRDAQGRLNQAMARACDRVTFVAAGLPLNLKSDAGLS